MNDITPQRVILVDGDADVRRALALLLQTALGFEIVGEAAELTGLAAPGQPRADLLLADWASIAPTAPQLLSRLHSLNCGLRVVVLSTRPEARDAALAAGADAFLSKVDSPEQVIATLRQLLEASPVPK